MLPITQGIILRRTKQSKIDGEPVVRLPPRLHRMACPQFSPAEQEFYERIEREATAKVKVSVAQQAHAATL